MLALVLAAIFSFISGRRLTKYMCFYLESSQIPKQNCSLIMGCNFIYYLYLHSDILHKASGLPNQYDLLFITILKLHFPFASLFAKKKTFSMSATAAKINMMRYIWVAHNP